MITNMKLTVVNSPLPLVYRGLDLPLEAGSGRSRTTMLDHGRAAIRLLLLGGSVWAEIAVESGMASGIATGTEIGIEIGTGTECLTCEID